MSTLETIGLILGLLGGGSALLYPLIKKIRYIFKTWGRFITDWEGEESAPGRDAVPGVMQRLNKLDGELTHNGGKSVKDVVTRSEKRIDRLEKKLEEAETTRRENHERLLEAINALSTQKSKL